MQATHKEEWKIVLYLNTAAKFTSHLAGRDQNQGVSPTEQTKPKRKTQNLKKVQSPEIMK